MAQACANHDTHRAIGSIPRPVDLIERVAKGDSEDPNLHPLYEDAIRDTIERFEATGSPVVTDGEQRKYHNFATYCVHGLPNTAPDGFKISFSDGHTRRLSRLTRGPFRYRPHADCYLDVAMHARAGQAGGDIAFGFESDVPHPRGLRITRASNSSRIC
jgi:5-methyltetrahydropteroyltriglutamate--homocysteine methyltransferase